VSINFQPIPLLFIDLDKIHVTAVVIQYNKIQYHTMTMDETKYMQTLAWATAVLTMKMMLLHLGVVRVRVSVCLLDFMYTYVSFMHISHAHLMS